MHSTSLFSIAVLIASSTVSLAETASSDTTSSETTAPSTTSSTVVPAPEYSFDPDVGGSSLPRTDAYTSSFTAAIVSTTEDFSTSTGPAPTVIAYTTSSVMASNTIESASSTVSSGTENPTSSSVIRETVDSLSATSTPASTRSATDSVSSSASSASCHTHSAVSITKASSSFPMSTNGAKKPSGSCSLQAITALLDQADCVDKLGSYDVAAVADLMVTLGKLLKHAQSEEMGSKTKATHDANTGWYLPHFTESRFWTKISASSGQRKPEMSRSKLRSSTTSTDIATTTSETVTHPTTKAVGLML